ncbi:11617_t:CDS:2 [Ambispora gerdemannii]|uniref:11617_t:CDS:1 n=1 Tax=Ambispora gerdemannii TaxID=144530 RepID=A0A9N8YT29_9GLOM|nr:11617_t:CDS:2 [Ambispora gerdemannii]
MKLFINKSVASFWRPKLFHYPKNMSSEADIAAALEHRLLGDEATVEKLLLDCEVEREKDQYSSRELGWYSYDRGYPWDPRKANRTSDENFHILQQKISQLSGSKLRLVRLNLKMESSNDDASNSEINFGIVAQCNITRNTIIWQEKVFLHVNSRLTERCDNCNKRITDENKFICEISNCNEIFCNAKCYQEALKTFHKPLCGKDLTPILQLVQEGRSSTSLFPLFVLKLFAIAKQRDICPLDIEEIKHLARDKPLSGSMCLPEPLIFIHQKAQEILDIPMGDLRFDFWIFLTCYSMAVPNTFTRRHQKRPDVLSVFSLTSLINHECRPNASVNGEQLIAIKRVKKNEPVTISYIGEEDSSYQNRQAMLHLWGFECNCWFCLAQKDKPTVMSRMLEGKMRILML